MGFNQFVINDSNLDLIETGAMNAFIGNFGWFDEHATEQENLQKGQELLAICEEEVANPTTPLRHFIAVMAKGFILDNIERYEGIAENRKDFLNRLS